MDVFSLTRHMVDMESITGNEAGVGQFLLEELTWLGFAAEKMAVPFPPEIAASGRERFNVYAESGPGAAPSGIAGLSGS